MMEKTSASDLFQRLVAESQLTSPVAKALAVAISMILRLEEEGEELLPLHANAVGAYCRLFDAVTTEDEATESIEAHVDEGKKMKRRLEQDPGSS